ERLAAKWTAPIYAFYQPLPTVGHTDAGRRFHEFHCMGRNCKKSVKRYLDGNDSGSTSNLHKHAKSCWGDEAVKAADAAKTAKDARENVTTPLRSNGTITAAFARTGKGKISYMHRQHTRAEMRQRPFSIVEDEGFNILMKTGRPETWIPSSTTVARDVRTVFKNARKRIASLLQAHDGALNFATDAWTSPNHRAYCAVSVHFEVDGVPMSFLLDVVEIAKSHSGMNLAIAF
ncbi:hypothetical protein EXIGLDRAFT_576221, partial [Exidia glandulosa HHB12029]